jgi:hypothetical protein
MIERPAIIVTSLGRTGTTFFSALFGEIIPNCNSFHEPDIVQYFGTTDRLEAFKKRVRDAGFYNMIFRKLLGRWSLIKLSDKRLLGKLSDENAVRDVLRQRTGFVNSKHGSVYIESNAGYYGLIDILRDVYRHHKVIFLIRDGRDWVSSAMRVEELYGKRGIRKLLAHKMPEATQFPDDPLRTDWPITSRFVKLCWAWSKLNEYALHTASKNPHARVFKFENIFSGNEKYSHLKDVIELAAALPGLEHVKLRGTEGWLEKKINQSSNDTQAWQNWTPEEQRQFESICAPLMERLGYKV